MNIKLKLTTEPPLSTFTERNVNLLNAIEKASLLFQALEPWKTRTLIMTISSFNPYNYKVKSVNVDKGILEREK